MDGQRSRVQPPVAIGSYGSPSAGAADAEGPPVTPAFVAESFEGFEVTEQGPDRLEEVASFASEEYPSGQAVVQE